MSVTCFKCGRDAFVKLKIQSTIGQTALEVSKHAEQTAVCAGCLLDLAEWFGMNDQTEEIRLRAKQ